MCALYFVAREGGSVVSVSDPVSVAFKANAVSHADENTTECGYGYLHNNTVRSG